MHQVVTLTIDEVAEAIAKAALAKAGVKWDRWAWRLLKRQGAVDAEREDAMSEAIEAAEALGL